MPHCSTLVRQNKQKPFSRKGKSKKTNRITWGNTAGSRGSDIMTHSQQCYSLKTRPEIPPHSAVWLSLQLFQWAEVWSVLFTKVQQKLFNMFHFEFLQKHCDFCLLSKYSSLWHHWWIHPLCLSLLSLHKRLFSLSRETRSKTWQSDIPRWVKGTVGGYTYCNAQWF